MNILNEGITRKRYPPLPILDFSRTSKNQYILFYSSFPQLVAGCLTPHLLLPPPPTSSAVLLSPAFSFAPNLRPIIAAEEAISNLNETPSRSAPALLASPRLAIDRIHHRRSSSPVGRRTSSPETIVCLHATLFFLHSVLLRNFDPVHATRCAPTSVYHPFILRISTRESIGDRLKILVSQFFLVYLRK